MDMVSVRDFPPLFCQFQLDGCMDLFLPDICMSIPRNVEAMKQEFHDNVASSDSQLIYRTEWSFEMFVALKTVRKSDKPNHVMNLFLVKNSFSSQVIRLINNPNLTKSLQPLSHRRLVGDLSIYYRYFNGHCSQEIRDIIPVPLRRVSNNLSLHNPTLVTFGGDSLRFLGPKIWIGLLQELKSAEVLILSKA